MGSYISEPGPDLAPLPPKDVLLGLRTGKVRSIGGVKISSAINKQSRQGRVKLVKWGFTGDERMSPHLTFDNAVFQYNPSHYAFWKKTLPTGREHICKAGAFGENLSMTQLSEDNVCIGDKFRLGPEAVIQVSMPRQPCYKLNHRFEYKKMSSLAQSTGRTGWYYRVIQEGYVQEGDEMVLMERINPAWPVSRVQHFTYKDTNNMQACAEISELPGLSELFIGIFRKRLINGVEDMNGRLNGRTALLWRPYKLVEKKPLTPRVKKFVFAAEDSNTDADQECGRFPHVRLRFGPDARYTRAYSVVSGDMRVFELGIARDDYSRGGSLFLHNEFEVGDVLNVAKGHNEPKPKDQVQEPHARKHIFILGGIGVTAFIGEIRAFAQVAADIEIHYAVRSRREAAYLNNLPTDTTTVYAKNEGQRLNMESLLPPIQDALNPEVMIYCCGPASLLDTCRDRCEKLGYPRSHTHFEEFGGAATGTGDPFEAEIKSIGKVLQVPREKSLLQVLNDAGLEIESSCLVGNCGLCMIDYSQGDVVHQGVALDDEQKKETMLSCVSRGKGRIMLDC